MGHKNTIFSVEPDELEFQTKIVAIQSFFWVHDLMMMRWRQLIWPHISRKRAEMSGNCEKNCLLRQTVQNMKRIGQDGMLFFVQLNCSHIFNMTSDWVLIQVLWVWCG